MRRTLFVLTVLSVMLFGMFGGSLALNARAQESMDRHPIVGAWRMVDGGQLFIFTSDGLFINIETAMGEDGPLSRVGIGAWEATGEQTAGAVSWLEFGDGGHAIYQLELSLAQDGDALTGFATVTLSHADRTVEEFSNTILAFRLTMDSVPQPDATPMP